MTSAEPTRPPAEAPQRESLSVVVPAYNEEASLEGLVREILAVLQARFSEFEVVIVNDGSTDATGRIADELAGDRPEVKVAHHETNQGSGMAIRTGIGAAQCDLVMYVPADNQFDLDEISAYADAAGEADIVVGVRDSRSDYSRLRLLSSWTFIHLTNLLFGFRYRDVNWVHLWRRRIFDDIKPRARGVFLMEEILVQASELGLKTVEIDSVYRPRTAGEAKGSSVRAILLAVYEVFRCWFHLKLGKQC